MSRFTPPPESLASLKDKVTVVTGGANGIGAATVRLFYEGGAKVVFGDVDVAAGDKLVAALDPENVTFVKADAANYKDNLQLFRTALDKYGKVDHAVSVAGIGENVNWFHPGLTLETVEEIPSQAVLDVNIIGVLYFARIASVYLRQNRKDGEDKSLTFLSSLAGFKESPGLFLYQISKHGVLGLMRSLRRYLTTTCGIRVNAVCPFITDTAMGAPLLHMIKGANIPINSAEDVGKTIIDTTRLEGLNGKTFYVEGGRSWEIEENLDRLEPQWLGEECSKDIEKITQLLQGVTRKAWEGLSGKEA